MLSATQAYNFCQCPHRLGLDVHGDSSKRDEPNPFVELLWEGGVAHEADTIKDLGISVDLSRLPHDEREQATLQAIADGAPLIYQGRLTVGDRVGEPDLLEVQPGGGYRPGDIKAGAGLEGDDENGKLKKTYAIQTAHYTSMLDELGLSDKSGTAFIVDGSGERVDYPLHTPQGQRNPVTWMQAYSSVVKDMREIVSGQKTTLPALSATCKLCCWYSHCKQAVLASNDLTMIAELGRSKRDSIIRLIPTVKDLAAANLDSFAAGKKTVFPGIGPGTLQKFQDRALLLSTPGARPYLTEPVNLPTRPKEVLFDIEADPMRGGFVYLHGFVERDTNKGTSATRFVPQITPDVTPEAEEEAFRASWQYLVDRVADSAIYYYSPYERVAYTALARRFPSVCSPTDVIELFRLPEVVDLYTDVVRKATEWPTLDRSIKTLAVYLGFSWRDSHPSGAASIQWFDEWVKTRDEAKLIRILDYNSDDCTATAVVLDGVRHLPLRAAA